MSTRHKLTCPACGSDKVLVREETLRWVNTGEHWCHSVKTQDPYAKVQCTACDWDGLRHELKGQA